MKFLYSGSPISVLCTAFKVYPLNRKEYLISMGQYGFSFYDQPYILDMFARQMAHQSLWGDFCNLSSVPSISASFKMNAI